MYGKYSLEYILYLGKIRKFDKGNESGWAIPAETKPFEISGNLDKNSHYDLVNVYLNGLLKLNKSNKPILTRRASSYNRSFAKRKG